MSTKKILLICLAILLLAAAVIYLIFSTEPTANAEGATKKTAMLVDVVQVERENYTPVIVATGSVAPVEDLVLSSQVGGQVLRRSPAFVPGGFVKENELLLQIDPSDYRNILEMRRSELLQTQTDLDIEMGGQNVAQQDLELAGVDSLSPSERSLILRQPQLEAIRARLKSARAAVEQAELDLARTTIRAPFDAHILNQEVTVGAQISPGDNLGRLVGTASYWVRVSLPVHKLQWLEFPNNDTTSGSLANIRSANWREGAFRKGRLAKRIGALDEQTRLAQILIEVEDPLVQREIKDTRAQNGNGKQGGEPGNQAGNQGKENGNETGNEDKNGTQNDNESNPERETENGTNQVPELIIGTFVEAHLQARELKNVVRLSRDFVRSNQTVWVMQEGKLDIREVEIILSDAEYAYISKGLNDQDQVVTTNLSTVAEGISLRTESTEAATETTNPNETEE